MTVRDSWRPTISSSLWTGGGSGSCPPGKLFAETSSVSKFQLPHDGSVLPDCPRDICHDVLIHCVHCLHLGLEGSNFFL